MPRDEDEAFRLQFDKMRCDMVLLNSAVKALLTAHPNKRMLANYFDRRSAKDLKTLDSYKSLHPEALAWIKREREELLKGLLEAATAEDKILVKGLSSAMRKPGSDG